MKFMIYNQDCLKKLKELEDNSIDSIVTDPPYGLKFMNKHWDHSVPSVEIWRECIRVLKPGGHLLAFFGTRTYHRGVINIEDAGFEIRDQIGWAYGSGFPKSFNLKDEWKGWGTALKPAWEPIVVARKPLSEKTVAENVLKWGVGGLNIDGCRIAMGEEYDPTRVHRQKSNRFTWEGGKMSGFKADHIQASYNAAGRWPANLIHDGSEEVVKLFPRPKSGIAVQRNGGSQKIGGTGIYSGSKGLTRPDVGYQDSGSAARFFYCAKASKKDRHDGLEEPGNQFKHGSTLRKIENTKTKGNDHPTVKPTDLMRYLCKLVTPPNGTVLDPFMGSGSTGRGALLEGFNFIGIEIDEEYCKIAEMRIQAVVDKQITLEDFFE